MKSPFKFLDAYTIHDKDVFWGREEEVELLYQMVFNSPLALVYGMSGTGKTSLIKCGLASRFDGPDWFPFFVRRGKNINQSLMQSLDEFIVDDLNLDLIDSVSYIYTRYLRPVYLIFDQFEELFVRGEVEEQQKFFNDIQLLINAELQCRIIFIIREEYLGTLYSFEKLLPAVFKYRLRLEPMLRENTKRIISTSCIKFHIQIENNSDAQLERMVDNIKDNESGIRLPYLQAYLDMLYRRSYERVKNSKTKKVVFLEKEIAAIGGFDDILDRFLEDQIKELQRLVNQKFLDPNPNIVLKVLNAFVTKNGTNRSFYYKRIDKFIDLEFVTEEEFPKLNDAIRTYCLEELQQRRILHFTDKNIELAHDTLAKLIDNRRTDEERELNEISRQIKNNYVEYRLSGQFLNAKQLKRYEDFIDRIDLKEEEKKFIVASKEKIEREKKIKRIQEKRDRELIQKKKEISSKKRHIKRITSLAIVVGILGFVATYTGFWALKQKNKALDLSSKLEVKNKELEQARIDLGISNAKSLKNNGGYKEGIENLNYVNSIYKETETHLPEEISILRMKWDTLSILVPLADSLATFDDKLTESLSIYKEAIKIDPKNELLLANAKGIKQKIIDRHKYLKLKESRLSDFGELGYSSKITPKRKKLEPFVRDTIN